MCRLGRWRPARDGHRRRSARSGRDWRRTPPARTRRPHPVRRPTRYLNGPRLLSGAGLWLLALTGNPIGGELDSLHTWSSTVRRVGRVPFWLTSPRLLPSEPRPRHKHHRRSQPRGVVWPIIRGLGPRDPGSNPDGATSPRTPRPPQSRGVAANHRALWRHGPRFKSSRDYSAGTVLPPSPSGQTAADDSTRAEVAQSGQSIRVSQGGSPPSQPEPG